MLDLYFFRDQQNLFCLQENRINFADLKRNTNLTNSRRINQTHKLYCVLLYEWSLCSDICENNRSTWEGKLESLVKPIANYETVCLVT